MRFPQKQEIVLQTDYETLLQHAIVILQRLQFDIQLVLRQGLNQVPAPTCDQPPTVILIMQSDQDLQKQHSRYFFIVSEQTKEVLSMNKGDYDGQRPHLRKMEQDDPDQLWMAFEIKPQILQIVHAQSTLVLDLEKGVFVLRLGKQTKTQLFQVERAIPKRSSFKLKVQSEWRYLSTKEGGDGSEAVWQLKSADTHFSVRQSVVFQSAVTDLVFDVPGASIQEGTRIILYYKNDRFNQRWRLVPSAPGIYFIQNMRSQLFLDVDGGEKNPGRRIIQYRRNSQPNQLWAFQPQGKGLFLIRSLLDTALFLTLSDSSAPDQSNLVTGPFSPLALWKIQNFPDYPVLRV